MAAVTFGDMIMHCSNPEASAESVAFAKWLTIGLKDSKFNGLIGLLSYGDGSNDAKAMVAKVASWAEHIFTGAVDADEWIEVGFNIVALEVSERITNFEQDLRSYFESLLDPQELALTASKVAKFEFAKVLEQLENGLLRAADGISSTGGHLSALTEILKKIVAVLKAFGSIDPSKMILGWINNVKAYLFGLQDASLGSAEESIAQHLKAHKAG